MKKKTKTIFFYGDSQYFKLKKKYGKIVARAKPCGYTFTGRKMYKVNVPIKKKKR